MKTLAGRANVVETVAKTAAMAVKKHGSQGTFGVHEASKGSEIPQPRTDGVSVAMVPVLPERQKMEATIAFRLPSKWKANIEKQLLALGVPNDRFSEFYRGAIIAGIGNSVRAQSPEWREFLLAVQPIAKAKLGAELTDAGLDALIRQGMVLPGTPS